MRVLFEEDRAFHMPRINVYMTGRETNKWRRATEGDEFDTLIRRTLEVLSELHRVNVSLIGHGRTDSSLTVLYMGDERTEQWP